MSAIQCRHRKPDRRRCRANAQLDSGYCFFHDPAVAAERNRARRAGGLERSRKPTVLASDVPDEPLESAGDVVRLLAQAINQVRRGNIDPRISNAIGYIAGTLLKAMEQEQIEKRLAQLESILKTQSLAREDDFDPYSFVFRQPGEGEALA